MFKYLYMYCLLYKLQTYIAQRYSLFVLKVLLNTNQPTSLAYAHCTVSDSEQSTQFVSDICQPVTHCARVYHTNLLQSAVSIPPSIDHCLYRLVTFACVVVDRNFCTCEDMIIFLLQI